MIDTENPYFKRVQLLIRILPHLSVIDHFALKGGTAINLFLRDMPRLSVDIDLVYVPIKQRDTSLDEITESFRKWNPK
jgi:predicted nucleotidyltransferase component of viral defense system